jgi:hypothetical protein
MTTFLSAIPAYGRDYPPGEEGEEAVREDWANKKDFLIQDIRAHGYINIDDKPSFVQLNIRYNELQDICVIEAEEEEGAWQCGDGHMFRYQPPPAFPPWCGKIKCKAGNFRWILKDEVTSGDWLPEK